MPYNHYTFDYYFGEDYTLLEGPWTNGGQNAGQVRMELSGMLGGSDSVWYVQSESQLWDARDLTQSWLGEHGWATEEAHFALVDVWRS